MLVDPSTGEPISLSQAAGPAALGSTAGYVGGQVAMGAGAPPGGRVVETLSHLPAASHVAGWNALRGSQTILGGARVGEMSAKHALNFANFNVTLNPKYWGKLPNYASLDVASRSETGYTPFQFLGGDIGNSVVRRGLGRMSAERLGKMGIFSESEISGIKAGEKTNVVGGGFASRLTSSARLMWNKPTAKRSANIMKFLEGSGNKELASAARSAYGGAKLPMATTSDLSHLQASTMRGPVSQAAMGYFQGGMAGTNIDYATKPFMPKAYVRGVEKAAEHLGGAGLKSVGGRIVADTGSTIGKQLVEQGVLKADAKVGFSALGKIAGASVEKAGAEVATKVGATAALKAGGVMGARAVGMALPGVNAVMTAMMVYDLTKMGISAMQGGMETAKDAFKSFQGSLYKPAMGMGYRDTEVAATSRQRGVMAIQSSRLNARSVLGNEAAGMSAHFG